MHRVQTARPQTATQTRALVTHTYNIQTHKRRSIDQGGAGKVSGRLRWRDEGSESEQHPHRPQKGLVSREPSVAQPAETEGVRCVFELCVRVCVLYVRWCVCG